MITQLSLRDAAIVRCDTNADPFTKEMIDRAIANAAQQNEYITSCTVRAELRKLHWTLGKEPRCLGGRLQAAWKAGLIEPTDQMRICTCGTRHGAKVTLWKVKHAG